MFIRLFEDNPNTREILKVVEILEKGGVIIYPTDTVYAIGCDIYNVKAVQRVAQLKSELFHDMSRFEQYFRVC